MITAERNRNSKPNTARYTLAFMKGVLLTNRETGAVGPSSRALADAVTRMADLGGRKVLVEYGPGTGVFTEMILQRMDADAELFAFDVNPEFVAATRERCPRAKVFEAGAQQAIDYLREAGHSHCDAIISGLPWTRFPDALQDEILEATWKVLRPGGRFVTFAYATSPLVPSGRKFFLGKLPARFPNVKQSKQIWKNIPPCVVFSADKH
jgi:phospholipid N-methyltransferase